MIIRQARAADAEAIATYLMLAMEDILFEFIGQTDSERAKAFLLHFVQQEDNQYAYQNCLVAELDQQVVAALNIYDGAQLLRLRSPIAHYIKTKFSINFNPENETQAGEYYIDSFGVSTAHQGKGIGAKMLQHVIGYYVHQQGQTVGLLVDHDNIKAERLYTKLGFKPVGHKLLVGKTMKHLQIAPS